MTASQTSTIPLAASAGPPWVWPALAAILVLAAALRLPTLTVESLWLDEVLSWNQVNGSFAQLIERTARDNYPPLHNLLTYASTRLLGDSAWSLRLPSALLGIGNVGLIFLLGRRLGGPVAGLLAALLLATSSFHIWYSQEARPYALICFGVTWLAVASLALVERPGWRNAIAVFLPTVVIFYTHAYGMVAAFAVGVGIVGYAVVRRQFTRRLLLWLAVANVAAAVAFLPWVRILAGRTRIVLGGDFWIQPLTWAQLRVVLDLAGGYWALPVVAAGVIFAVAFRGHASRAPGAITLLALWGVLPGIFAVAISLLIQPLLVSRYLIGVVPAWCAFAALGWAPVLSMARSWPRALALLVPAVAVGAGALVNFDPREDWRGVAAFLDRTTEADDCVVMAPYWYVEPMHYYRRSEQPCLAGRATDLDPSSAALLTASDIFLVLAWCDANDPSLLARFEAAGWFGAVGRFNKVDVWHLTRTPPASPTLVTGAAPPIAPIC